MDALVEGATTRVRTRPRLPSNLTGAKVHLIGIGGSGMSGAATLLSDLGARVTGSDLVAFKGLGQLVAKGVQTYIGHSESHLPRDANLVIASAAIPVGNPELSAARQQGIAVMTYAEFLGALMDRHCGVAISGTHGKSTTSGMCVHLFQQAGLSPSFVIGARSAQLGGSSGVGGGPHLIVESCEFNRSFLHLRPKYAAILNIEPDHLDFYRNVEDIVEAFGSFAASLPPDGVLICNGEDERALHAAGFASAAVEAFGFKEGVHWQACDLRVDQGRFSFEVRQNGQPLLRTSLSIPGRYNVANALAAIAIGIHAGIVPDQVAQIMPRFAGVDRRLTLRLRAQGITVLDDYAHHPTEIRVTIEAARSRYQPRRTLVVFQPHQYSRTRHFMEQFADSFLGVDEVLVPEIYGARESRDQFPSDGAAELVSRICRKGGRARYFPKLEQVTDHLTHSMTEGDLVLTMGAGDVWKVADELVERLRGSDRVPCPPGEPNVVSPRRSCPVPVPSP